MKIIKGGRSRELAHKFVTEIYTNNRDPEFSHPLLLEQVLIEFHTWAESQPYPLPDESSCPWCNHPNARHGRMGCSVVINLETGMPCSCYVVVK